nr:ABC transporter substrate-binding protein [Actinomycetales bacterium]
MLLSACSGAVAPGSTTEGGPVVASPGPGETSAPGQPVTIGLTYVPDIQFAPFYVAEASGYFADEGLEVTLRHHGAQESLFGSVVAGDETVVVSGADEMLQAHAGGVPLVTTGVLYQEYPAVLIVPEDSEIQEVADIRGRNVGLPGPFGENWFALLAWMDREGLDEDDLTITSIGFTQQASLMAGNVDAVVGFSNNDLVQFQLAGFPVRAIDSGELPLVGIGIGAMAETVDTRAEQLAAVNRAVSRALQDIIADPEAAVDLSLRSQPDLAVSTDAERALTTLTATVPLYGDGSLAVDASMWPIMYEFMVEANLAEPGLDPSQALVADLAG